MRHATFAGGFCPCDGQDAPVFFRGNLDRSSDCSDWVAAPGFPVFNPGDDMAEVVAHDSNVVVIVTNDNHHDATTTLWFIRKDDPRWLCCGCCRQDSARGRYVFNHYKIVNEGILASHDEHSRGTGEEMFPWAGFYLPEASVE